MAILRDDKVTQRINDSSRVKRGPAAWVVGGVFLLALLGALFFYDGRDTKTTPGPNTPNVVDNPTGSKE